MPSTLTFAVAGAASPYAPGIDQYAANVVVRARFDTSLTLNSIAGGASFTNVNATLHSGSKYGPKCAAFNGADQLITVPSNAVYAFGANDFTIEFWMYPVTDGNTGAAGMMLDGRPDNTNGNYIIIYYGSSRNQKISAAIGTTNILTSGTLASINQWYHVAFTRIAGIIYLFVDGVLQGSVANATSVLQGGYKLGANAYRSTQTNTYFNGRMDDLRITQGIGRYSATFTPPRPI